MGYMNRSKGYRFYCPSRNTKFVMFINVKLFETSGLSGSSKVKDIVFKEERQNVTILIVLNKLDMSVEHEYVVISDELFLTNL